MGAPLSLLATTVIEPAYGYSAVRRFDLGVRAASLSMRHQKQANHRHGTDLAEIAGSFAKQTGIAGGSHPSRPWSGNGVERGK